MTFKDADEKLKAYLDAEYKKNRIAVDRVDDLVTLASRQIRKGNRSLKSFVQSLVSLPGFKNAEIKQDEVARAIRLKNAWKLKRSLNH
jgi:oligoribonuclease NrnB/cAMP/cGMP phosphodiesterase (DHH superfamily)